MGAKFKTSSQPKREPIPEGQYDVRCYGVAELGTHTRTGKFGTKTNAELMIMFELPELQITYEKDGVEVTAPRVINQRLNNSMGEKSKLRAFINAWRGKKLTDDEAANFDVAKVLSHGASISIEHNGEYANIATIGPLHKSVQLPAQHNPTINFGIEDMNGPEFDKLYPWVQNIIKESAEFLAMQDAQDAKDMPGQDNEPDVDMEDIPF